MSDETKAVGMGRNPFYDGQFSDEPDCWYQMRKEVLDALEAWENSDEQRQLRADAERLDRLQEIFIKGEEFRIVMCEGKNVDGDCEHDTHPHFEAFDWSWRSDPVRSNTLRGVIDQAIEQGSTLLQRLRSRPNNGIESMKDETIEAMRLALISECGTIAIGNARVRGEAIEVECLGDGIKAALLVYLYSDEQKRLRADAERLNELTTNRDFSVTQNIGHDWIVVHPADIRGAIDKARGA